jgi:DNA invertase Pin-like site-specific DNA recombinase
MKTVRYWCVGSASYDRDPGNGLWAYCCVSTTKEEHEESLETQQTWAGEFARERGVGILVVREQTSAKTTLGRPRFNARMTELAALLKSRRPEILLVTSLDRLSRSTRYTLILLRLRSNR